MYALCCSTTGEQAAASEVQEKDCSPTGEIKVHMTFMLFLLHLLIDIILARHAVSGSTKRDCYARCSVKHSSAKPSIAMPGQGFNDEESALH